MSDPIVRLDVREDLRAGREPFSKIMAAVKGLRRGEQLLIVATFEPKPLYTVLGRFGFAHTTRQTPEGDWEVLFYRENQPNQDDQND